MENLSENDLLSIIDKLDPADIGSFCRTTSSLYHEVCKNDIFLRALARKYLTINDIGTENVLRDIIYINAGYNKLEKLEPGVEKVIQLIARSGYEIAMGQFVTLLLKLNDGRDALDDVEYTKYNFLIDTTQFGYIYQITNFSAFVYYHAGVNGQLSFIKYLLQEWYFDVVLNQIDVPAFFLGLFGAIIGFPPWEENGRIPVGFVNKEDTIRYLLNYIDKYHNNQVNELTMQELTVDITIVLNSPLTQLILTHPFIAEQTPIHLMDLMLVVAVYYSKDLIYFNRISSIMTQNWNYNFQTIDLLTYIPETRFNLTPGGYQIALYLVNLTREARKFNRVLEINRGWWDRTPDHYDPAVHNIDNANISKTVSYLINERVANPQWIILGV